MGFHVSVVQRYAAEFVSYDKTLNLVVCDDKRNIKVLEANHSSLGLRSSRLEIRGMFHLGSQISRLLRIRVKASLHGRYLSETHGAYRCCRIANRMAAAEQRVGGLGDRTAGLGNSWQLLWHNRWLARLHCTSQ